MSSTLRGKSFKRCGACNNMARSNRSFSCWHCGAAYSSNKRPAPPVKRKRKKPKFDLDAWLEEAVELESKDDALLEKEIDDFLKTWLDLEQEEIKTIDSFKFFI